MARQNGQKTKLLFLYKLLLERGDEDNPISTPELIEALAARDIDAILRPGRRTEEKEG